MENLLRTALVGESFFAGIIRPDGGLYPSAALGTLQAGSIVAVIHVVLGNAAAMSQHQHSDKRKHPTHEVVMSNRSQVASRENTIR